MSRRSRKNFRRCGSRITFSGTFPANPYLGQMGMAPRWPLYASAPATVVNGQSFRLPESGQEYGRAYLGRYVAELNGPDTLNLPPVSSNLSYNNWKIKFGYRDGSASQTVNSRILQCYQSGVLKLLMFQDTGSRINIHLRNDGSNTIFSLYSDYVLPPLAFYIIELEKKGNVFTITVNGVVKSATLGTTWDASSIDNVYISDISAENRPMGIVDVSQYLNGNLLDFIPCLETSGTSLANTASPLRPATLSDSAAHALAWVPQDRVTFGRWIRRPTGNLAGFDSVVFKVSLPANGTTDPWELEYLWKCDGNIASGILAIAATRVGSDVTKHVRIQADIAIPGRNSVTWRTTGDNSFISRNMDNVIDASWHKIRVEVTPSLKGRFFIDGIQAGADADLSTWSPGTTDNLAFLGAVPSGTMTYSRIANVKAWRNGVPLLCANLSDGSGATLTDCSGNGNNGTIVDVSPATFWTDDWVPMD